MDGNGRWAKDQGLKRVLGHQNGTKAVRETVEGAVELGIKHLTLFAFSTENWKRPQLEINTLMKLLVSSLKKELPTLLKNNIRLLAIGNLQSLPSKAYNELNEVMSKAATHSGLTLTLALSYGAREEIVKAVKDISEKVKNNIISPENLDETIINEHLYTQNLPEVDLLIRTSGEYRVSNFLLWQIAYAELYFTPVFWPEFNKEDLFKAIVNYQQRERRFGKTSEQLQ